MKSKTSYHDIHERTINPRMMRRIREDATDQYGAVDLTEASLRTKLSKSYICEIESGKRGNAFLLTLHKLAKAYHGYIDLRFVKIDAAGIRTYYDLLE